MRDLDVGLVVIKMFIVLSILLLVNMMGYTSGVKNQIARDELTDCGRKSLILPEPSPSPVCSSTESCPL